MKKQRHYYQIKCPVCEKERKTHAKEYFHCCGGKWRIAENLLGEKDPIIDEAEPRDISDVAKMEEMEVELRYDPIKGEVS